MSILFLVLLVSSVAAMSTHNQNRPTFNSSKNLIQKFDISSSRVMSTYYHQNSNKAFYGGHGGKNITSSDEEIKSYQSEIADMKIPVVYFRKNSIEKGSKLMLVFKNQSEKILEESEMNVMKPWKKEADCGQGKGEIRACVDSKESMIAFVHDVMKTNAVKLVKTQPANMGIFEVVGEPKPIASKGITTCHKIAFPTTYAVYGCHYIRDSVVQLLPLKSLNDQKLVTAVTICHLNTTAWNANGFILRLLKMKPGGPVCHFLTTDDLVWLK